jgi:hypothetical protein
MGGSRTGKYHTRLAGYFLSILLLLLPRPTQSGFTASTHLVLILGDRLRTGRVIGDGTLASVAMSLRIVTVISPNEDVIADMLLTSAARGGLWVRSLWIMSACHWIGNLFDGPEL